MQQGTRGEIEKELRHLCKELDIPLQVAPKERLDKFTKGKHQGVLAFLSLITYHRIEDVLPGVYEQGEVPLLLILDGVTDVRNFGAIANLLKKKQKYDKKRIKPVFRYDKTC